MLLLLLLGYWIRLSIRSERGIKAWSRTHMPQRSTLLVNIVGTFYSGWIQLTVQEKIVREVQDIALAELAGLDSMDRHVVELADLAGLDLVGGQHTENHYHSFAGSWTELLLDWAEAIRTDHLQSCYIFATSLHMRTLVCCMRLDCNFVVFVACTAVAHVQQ